MPKRHLRCTTARSTRFPGPSSERVTPSSDTMEEPGRRFRDFHGTTSSWRKLREIEDRVFSEQRLLLYGSTVAVAYVVGLVWRLLRHEWVIRSDGNPTCI